MTALLPTRKKPNGESMLPDGEKALVIRTCNQDGTSHNGFVWPKSGYVECPDWNTEPRCGNGLHGLLWGKGNWSLLDRDNPLWQICEVLLSEVVWIDGDKVKFPRCNILYTGNMAVAITMILCNEEAMRETDQTSSGDSSKAASSGDSSKAASSGNYSTAASSGNSSTAASSGDSSKAASSGNSSTAASSGDSSKAASSGNYSTAASSGNSSTAASSGNSSTANATGINTIAMAAGRHCIVSAGESGCFATLWWDGQRNRVAVGYVGEDGIEAGVSYRLDDKGTFVKVDK
ncbi:hypothetical protein M0R72_10915 [Candidatus Pacearchaeota archaeon]|jgi:hypothetical protein|nr:hypothetical protein [Candidatus Pacearchaeota archaeon]